MIYNDQIKYKIIRLFGENSEIYLAFERGEKVSGLIRKTYDKKNVKHKNIREKRMLCEMCKEYENEYDEYSKYLSI